MQPAAGEKGPSGGQILGELLSLIPGAKQHAERAVHTGGLQSGSGRLPTPRGSQRGKALIKK